MRLGSEAEAGSPPFRGRAARLLRALRLTFALVALSPALVHAQEDDAPRVENIRFEGVDAVNDGELRASIATQETSCRALILQPICWVSDWSGVMDHQYLDEQELERDVIRLRVYYFRRGYRQTAVTALLEPTDEGVDVVFQIDEGEPTRITSLDVEQAREVLSDRAIRRARFPEEEDVLNLVEIDMGIAHLQETLGSDGYLDAQVRDTIRVDDSALRAEVLIAVQPGPRSTLDSLTIEGNEEVEDGVISEALRLERGRVLRVNDIVAAQRSLYESNLFHQAEVSVPDQADSAKTVAVRVREAPPRSVRIGGGFNTIEFLRTEARYTHYNWLGGGRRLTVRGQLGNLLAGPLNDRLFFQDVRPQSALPLDDAPFRRPTWQASVSFMQPAFRSAANTLGFDAFIHRRIVPGIAIDHGFGAGVSITRRLDHGVPLSLSYDYELTTVDAVDLYYCVNYGVCQAATIQALRGRNAMSPLTASLQLNRADNPIAPSSGYRANVAVEHASAATLSNFRYNRISGEGTYYHPLDVYRRRVLAGRVRLGWVRPLASTGEAVGLDVDDEHTLLHPRKRFYAGGSRSVRGYGENQLGPRLLTVDPAELMEPEEGDGCSEAEIRSGTCDPVVAPVDAFLPQPLGGTAVLEASVEYRFPLISSLNGAVFLDGALIGEGVGGMFDRGSWALTPGFGVRLPSPVGAIRLDIGIRPSVTERLPVVTEYAEEDGARRLVELDQRRRYNPVEAAGGGFFREIFSRIALHLSIGEAY